MMAAITAARQGAAVTILEGNDRVGKKILSTGNGKCNLGNRKLDPEEYYTEQPGRLRECLERFGTEDTVSFFQGIGLLIKEKSGYLYPACEQASAVLDVLRFELSALGIEVISGCKVKQILPGQLNAGCVRIPSGKERGKTRGRDVRIPSGVERGMNQVRDARSPSGKRNGEITLRSGERSFCFDS